MLRSKFKPAVETCARRRGYPDGQFHIDNDDFEDFLSAVQLTRGDEQYTGNTTEYKAIVRGDIGIHVFLLKPEPWEKIQEYSYNPLRDGALVQTVVSVSENLFGLVVGAINAMGETVLGGTDHIVITAEEIFREFPNFDCNEDNNYVTCTITM